MNALTIKNLSKTYADGTQALKEVDLQVRAGDFFALLGANGAGKTTLIGIVTGLVNKTAGEVKVFDINTATDFFKAKKMIGVVPQEFNFNIFEKVQDILVTQAGYFGIERKKALRDSKGILKQMGLWHKRDAVARTLSGGLKRRLMIARALVHKPKFLILDEPTAGVDVELRHGMWEYLRELNRQGTTILLTTHYLEEVEQMCRRAAIIKRGEIIKDDEVSCLVQLLKEEVYVVTVDEIQDLDKIKEYDPSLTAHNTFEVEINPKKDLQNFVLKITGAGMRITDIRPKGHRLEKLFLSVLKED